MLKMKWLEHLKTITAHKIMVMRHCFAVGLYKGTVARPVQIFMDGVFDGREILSGKPQPERCRA